MTTPAAVAEPLPFVLPPRQDGTTPKPITTTLVAGDVRLLLHALSTLRVVNMKRRLVHDLTDLELHDSNVAISRVARQLGAS